MRLTTVPRLAPLTKEWIDIAYCTEPADFTAARYWMQRVYADGGLNCPTDFREYRSPAEGLKNEVKSIADYCFGSMEFKLSRHDAYSRFGLLGIKESTGLMEIAKVCGWFAPYDKMVVLTDRPCEIHRKGDCLHREDGPAIRYRDGSTMWFIDGVPVDEQIVMAPETQTIEQIEAEKNAAVQRIRIKRYNSIRYLREICNFETPES